MAKIYFSDKRTDRFSAAVSVSQNSKKSLPSEIREDNLPACREAHVNELRKRYLAGSYYVSAVEISAALIDKHLKR